MEHRLKLEFNAYLSYFVLYKFDDLLMFHFLNIGRATAKISCDEVKMIFPHFQKSYNTKLGWKQRT